MEKIELRAKDAPAGFKHLYVVYTNDLGREFIVRAGPGPASVLDNIDVEWGQYTSVSRDWVAPADRNPQDNSLIATGADLSQTFLKMAFFAQLIEEADVGYATVGAIWGDNSSVTTDISQVACRLTSRSPDFARWASVFRPERCLSSRKRPKSGGSSLEPAAFWPGRAAFPRGRRTCPAAFVQLGHGSWSCA